MTTEKTNKDTIKPSEKSEGVTEFTAIEMDYMEGFATEMCPGCKKDIELFRDELSRQEYAILGLCQQCQDVLFGSTN